MRDLPIRTAATLTDPHTVSEVVVCLLSRRTGWSAARRAAMVGPRCFAAADGREGAQQGTEPDTTAVEIMSDRAATAGASISLSDMLGVAVQELWPRRVHQELLLDLGERKRWNEADRRAALDAAAAWLVKELELPASLETVPAPDDSDADRRALERVRSLGEDANLGDHVVGVARWACGIAPALGTSAKTLANTVSDRLRSDRNDHRWLRLIDRVMDVSGALDAWSYHRRSPRVVASYLQSLSTRARPDAGDALVVLSLLALWQRRRPTTALSGRRRPWWRSSVRATSCPRVRSSMRSSTGSCSGSTSYR